MSAPPPIVLTFAGSDPTGGAGLQADVLTLASMGCHPLSVVTALTVQDTHGVVSVEAVDAACVRMQAERVLADTRIAAIKLGLLGSAANVEAIAAILAEHAEIPVVLDPVLASGRG
ncbi:MAG: hydroxymethylpyrimidine/phosphomethylpyrimidine kinase, partial [Burkholderiales bacterium]